MELLSQIVLGLFIAAIIITILKIRKRGFFWRDRAGKELTLKQFGSRYKEGIINISPLQQTKTTLWSFIPIFAGLIWGITVMIIAKTWWMVLILGGSLPIISVQCIGNIQKYRAQKKCKEAMDEAMGIKPRKPKKKKRKKKK